jgi:hypothetical protein
VHSAHVSELEIPVTIQASKLVEGTDRQELFTEATKTTIVFENGGGTWPEVERPARAMSFPSK